MRKDISVQPVIMAGGSGTRLWPLSRAAFPKQFLVLTAGQRSLFQCAVQRAGAIGDDGLRVAPALIVGNEEHRFLLADQLCELGAEDARLLLEPAGRNTAPAMTLAALAAVEHGQDPVLVVTPADHWIPDQPAFAASMRSAVREAVRGAIVVLGVRPTRAEPGYGYIRAEGSSTGAQRVVQFVEKPDRATAQRYVDEGCWWNSGMFVVSASVWLAALQRFRPDIAAATRRAWDARRVDAQMWRPGADEFAQVPAESVDRAVIEACPGTTIAVRMVPLEAGFDDLGAWDAVWQTAEKDGAGNAQLGDAMLHDSRQTLVHATSRLVTVVGVDDIVVVETPDAVLVADRSRSQAVRQIVSALQTQGRDEMAEHRKVQRAWGWYDSVCEAPGFKVKRISVKPGAALSLQLHHHRAEHWVVVSGQAEVTNGDQVMRLGANQSTYIPCGQKHRLANPTDEPLEIIEVQTGSYLGEDDIVRFEDRYGRC